MHHFLDCIEALLKEKKKKRRFFNCLGETRECFSPPGRLGAAFFP